MNNDSIDNLSNYIDELNKVLKEFLLPNEEIVKIEKTTGGIANKVIKITTNQRNSYIFKIYKKLRNQSLPSELMHFLNNNGINVVEPINNEPIHFENTECSLFKYIENVPTVVNINLEKYLIKLLKKISEFSTKINNDEYYYKNKCNKEYLLLKEKKEYKLDKSIIESVLKKYDEIKSLDINNKKEVVHSDISTSNLLTSKDGYYLIDFDEVRFFSKLYDLSVILVKFYFNGKLINYDGARKFVNLYLKSFNEYTYEDCYNVFVYYVIKQLLEKFSDYEIYGIDLFSKQQQQDDFRNWIYYFEILEKIKKIFT